MDTNLSVLKQILIKIFLINRNLRKSLLLFLLSIAIGLSGLIGSAFVGLRQYQAGWRFVAFPSPPGPLMVRSEDGTSWWWEGKHEWAATWWSAHPPLSNLKASKYQTPARWSETERLVSQWGWSNFNYLDHIEVGWPLRSFWLVHAHYAEGLPWSSKTIKGYDLMDFEARHDWAPDWFGSGRVGFSILPTSPLWLGLVVDLLFWSLVAFSVLSLPRWFRAVRTVRRRRSGLCPACAYDLKNGSQGSVMSHCPECGHDA